MILNAAHISKFFGANNILNDVSVLINEHDKVAIVGPNGAGKTTLLRILTGESQSQGGTIAISKETKLGYLHQINDLDSDLTVKEELTTVIKPIIDMEKNILKIQQDMQNFSGEALDKLYEEYNRLQHAYELADGYTAESRVVGILKGLGFDESEFSKSIHSLSGGQKTRVFLGKLLLEKPDLILLDEPTNHLDLSSIEWLETYLMNYKGAVVIVSHDRYFLDRIATKVIDIDMGIATTYEGNYSQYSEKKSMLRDAALKAYINQQQSIKHQESVIEKLKSFNREKSIKRAESREKMLDKIDRIDKPVEIKTDMNLFFSECAKSGQDVLQIDNISKSFNQEHLFKDLSFELKRGEHVAIIGDNGTGKTTILKMITGLVNSDSGLISLGAGVEIAYYDQEHQVLHMEKTLFDELQDTYPVLDNTKIRNILAAFLFTGDDVFKRVGDLSGGERGRMSLAKLMLSNANFLILDEPTNHLDLVSKEVLESAIINFDGTVLYVSHDRYFINKTATRILDLKNHMLLNYIGNYDYYLEKKHDVENYIATVAAELATQDLDSNIYTDSNESSSSSSALDWRTAKEEQTRIKKHKRAIEKCESDIHKLESKLKEIEEAFNDSDIQTNVARLLELQKEKDIIDTNLEKLYEDWEILASEE